MTLCPCIVYGTPSRGPRCDEHTIKPSAHDRGYDNRWRRLSKQARRLQPWCSDCGRTDDLQTDHGPEAWTARAAGKRLTLAMVDVVCRDCNIARGAARGMTPRPTASQPPVRQSLRYTPIGGRGTSWLTLRGSSP